MPSVSTKSVSDLKEMNFTIPSYQRGYRWRNTQVTQLLNDLWEFYQDNQANPEAWYCLQPLVVAPINDGSADSIAYSENVLPCGHIISSENASKGTWTVIDGQQRLTTLFIILSQLTTEKNLKPIAYVTRNDSEEFLTKITSPEYVNSEFTEHNQNPDYYHMHKAMKAVEKWLNKNTELDMSSFAKAILDKAKFIWYETHEAHYDVFIRLNSGKISLSNAELIKALLLRETRFSDQSGTIKLQQLEIAGEWDRIEQALGNDEIWYFINPEPEAPRFYATRIDFLFELVLRKGFKNQDEIQQYVNKYEENCYIGFKVFSDFCKNHPAENPEETIWKEIQKVFRSIKSWHDDRSLYHRIGFLMNRKGEDEEKRFETLTDLLNYPDLLKYPKEKEKPCSRADFAKKLIERCGAAISNAKTNKFDQLEYNKKDKNKEKDNDTLNDVLLLFNLALLDRQNSEQSRYPFKTHTGTAWSLEHIHAKNERELTDKDRKQLFADLCVTVNATIEEVNCKLKDRFGEGNVSLEKRNDEKNGKDTLFLVCDQQNTNGLENLALLERKENSEFNNRLYPEKRRILSLLEKSCTNVDDFSAFIP